MENEDQVYGAGMPILDKLKMLAEWAPLIGRLQVLLDAQSPLERATGIVKALQWAAGKSNTTLDDEALYHLEAVLKTPEGQALFNWIVAKVAG